MTGVLTWAKEVLRIGDPAVLVVAVILGAALLLVRPKWGRRWIVAIATVYWIVSSPLGAGLLVMPLRHRFDPLTNPRDAASAGAIVVLGGGIAEVVVGTETLAYPVDSTALRTLEGARVFKLLGGQPLVVASGGIADPVHRTPEADIISDELIRLGIPRDRILVDRESRTTHDQAIVVTRMLRSRGIDRFVLVTSPTHMWRSVAVFRAEGANVIPSPAPLQSATVSTPLFFVPNAESLRISDNAIYDSLGAAYYWARGWFRPQVPAAAASERTRVEPRR